MKKYQVFRDKKLNELFEKKGYVKIPFLSEEEIKTLQEAFEEISIKGFELNNKKEIQFGTLSENIGLKVFQNEKIKSCFEKAAQKHLNKYKHTIGTFIIKAIGADAFGPHLNETYVDENKYHSIVVWIPLSDINQNHGTLWVVEESHNKFNFLIHRHRISLYFDHLREYLLKNKFLKPIDVKQGEAIIFHDRLIHYSSSNKSNKPRIVAAAFMRPEPATMVRYEVDKRKKTIAEYRFSNDNISTYVNPNLLEMERTKTLPFKHNKISQLDFDYHYKGISELRWFEKIIYILKEFNKK